MDYPHFSRAIGFLVVLVLAGCGQAGPEAPQPTELSSSDRIATRVAEERSVVETLTAAVPTNVASIPTEAPPPPPTAAPPAPTEVPPPPPTAASPAPTEVPPPPPTAASPAPTEVPPPPPTAAPPPPTEAPLPTEEPAAYRDVNFGGTPRPDEIPGGARYTLRIAGADGEEDGKPIVRTRFAIRLSVRIPADARRDGDGISVVEYSISGNRGTSYTRSERNASYCSFGGGEPDCQLQSLTDDWPDDEYFVNMKIKPKDESIGEINWNFTFIIRR
jgi:hypothetical protein